MDKKLSQKKKEVAGKMSDDSKVARIFNPSHGSNLTNKEYDNSMKKYLQQRARRKN